MVFGLCTTNSFSAIPTYIKTIEKKPISVFVNTTNDIFLLYKGMLERYNADGTFFQNYGSIYINEHTEIISTTGFKTILYSPDFGKIIQLDNRLKELDIIDVYNLGTFLITCVGISYDNNFLWLFDASTQQLIKLDKNQKALFESNNLSLWTGTSITPNQIIESGIHLYIVDAQKGIFIFDNQGNYIKTIPIPNISGLKIYDNQLFYYRDNCIYSYQQLTFSEIKYTQTPKLNNIQLGKAILCGTNENGYVEIWKY
ncbi:MAG: hypothetical protein KDD21_12415 [Bacteroidetes bacterium]|nr:hypothetical protein [Bacteroidota bacterium]